jgi:hypothetical protein
MFAQYEKNLVHSCTEYLELTPRLQVYLEKLKNSRVPKHRHEAKLKEITFYNGSPRITHGEKIYGWDSLEAQLDSHHALGLEEPHVGFINYMLDTSGEGIVSGGKTCMLLVEFR